MRPNDPWRTAAGLTAELLNPAGLLGDRVRDRMAELQHEAGQERLAGLARGARSGLRAPRPSAIAVFLSTARSVGDACARRFAILRKVVARTAFRNKPTRFTLR